MFGRTPETQRITERRRRRLSRENWINMSLIGASCSIGGTLLIASINSGPKEPATTIPFRPVSTPSERPEPQSLSNVELPAAIQNAVFASEPRIPISAQVADEISNPRFQAWLSGILRNPKTSVSVKDCAEQQSRYLSRTYPGVIGDVTSLAQPYLNQRREIPSVAGEASNSPLHIGDVINWLGKINIKRQDSEEVWSIGTRVLDGLHGARDRVKNLFSQLEVQSRSGNIKMEHVRARTAEMCREVTNWQSAK